MGQQQDADVQVVTPFGMKPFGDLRVGDQITNPDGTVQRVLLLHELGDRVIYRVTFSDGASTLTTGDHRWLVNYSGVRLKADRRYPVDGGWSDRNSAVIRTTEQLAEQLAKCDAAVAAGKRPNWPLIPLTEPVEFTVTSRHPTGRWPIDPYLLGVLLGDGCVGSKAAPSFYSADPEIAQRVIDRGTPLRYEQHPGKPGQGTWWLDDDHATRGALRLLDAAHGAAAKFIPDAYKVAPLEKRWELARGLFDTDGTADTRGHVSYTTISERLASDVAWLVRSLGFKATTTSRIPTFTGTDGAKKQGQRAYTVTVQGDRCPDLFTLARKHDRCRPGVNGGDRAKRRMVKVERVGVAPARCITVDNPNGLYVTDDFIVTHNSDAGLMGALQFADVPGYSALIIRRTFQDLALPGAIMDRAGEWLSGTGAKPHDGGKRWEFPTADPGRPATLQFGYAQTHADITRYQGAEFQYVFVDELTHFEERTYRYLFSRLRGPAAPCANCPHPTSQPAGEARTHDEGHDLCAVCGHDHVGLAECPDGGLDGECGCSTYEPAGCSCVRPVADREALDELGRPRFVAAPDGVTLADVPLRMRSGSNPGGVGHEWVRARFIAEETREPRAVFVPAKLSDNPSLDRRAYRASLGLLTAVEKARLEDGDWSIGDEGDLFERSWFEIVDAAPAEARRVRYWDLAATVPKPAARKKQTDPDWTVGVLMALSPTGVIYIEDVVRFRKKPLETDAVMAQTAATDGRRVIVRAEQEPGSSGVRTIDALRRGIFAGYDFDGVRPELSKEERARPLARQAQAGNVKLVSAPWNREFLDEISGFPNLTHDDQVDGASGAYETLTGPRRARIIA